MTRVVALVAFSTGAITMEEKGVYDIDDALATDLIAQGLCADAATYFGGGSGGGVLVVTDTSGTLDKTWQEIYDALLIGGVVIVNGDNTICVVGTSAGKSAWYVGVPNAIGTYSPEYYEADSTSGYPVVHQ